MIQKEKDLLLQDLSSRLPYGVILECCGLVGEELRTMTKEGLINDDYDIDEVRPMLFPLSKMTKKQKEEFDALYWEAREKAPDYLFDYMYSSIKSNWLYKNHFDVNGLIPLGLAKNATGLNIY